QMFGKCLLYWFKYSLHDEAFAKYALPIPALASLLATPFWLWVSRRTSKRTTWLIALGVSALALIAFLADTSHSKAVILVISTAVALAAACIAFMFFAMIPDTVDYNELVTGERNEAKIFGFAVFAQKFALAVNAMLLGQLLELSGFVANREQAPQTLLAIKGI